MKQRLLDYMINNNFMDKDIQKAFLPCISGCIEHHSKLAAVISSARKFHCSLAIAWLDIANAYGSVHHSLIQFVLSHYHVPVEFSQIVQSLYSVLSASIVSQEWSTPLIPIQIGVYQGDPLSVSIFNTVMNTLIDTLKTRSELGFNLPKSSHKLNLLQFANDSMPYCQRLFSMPKSPKCGGEMAPVGRYETQSSKQSFSSLHRQAN